MDCNSSGCVVPACTLIAIESEIFSSFWLFSLARLPTAYGVKQELVDIFQKTDPSLCQYNYHMHDTHVQQKNVFNLKNHNASEYNFI